MTQRQYHTPPEYDGGTALLGPHDQESGLKGPQGAPLRAGVTSMTSVTSVTTSLTSVLV